MKSLIIFVTLVVTASCQIHTKLHDDGYHYDKPQTRLSIPETKPGCPNNAKLPYCCVNGAQNAECSLPTPPPPPAFLPKINLPSIIPVKPTQPAAVKRPIPPFPPIINLPSIIPVKPTSAPKIQVKPAAPVVVAPPAPFIPQKSLPVKPVTPKIIEKSLNDYLPPKEEEPEDEWTEWKRKFNKQYDSQEEDDNRRSIFEENVRQINLHNEEYRAGRVTFDLDKNKFCDLTQDEFRRIHTGIRGKKRAAAPVTEHPGYHYPKPEIEAFTNIEAFARSLNDELTPSVNSNDFKESLFKSSLPQSTKFSSSSSSSGGISNDFKESLFKSSLPESTKFSSSSSGGATDEFKESLFKSSLPSSVKFDSSSNSALPSSFKFPFPPPPSFLSSGGSSLPVSPSAFKSPSLPVSPSSFISNRQGQENMTNVFMASPMLAAETEDEVDWRKKGAITPVKNQGKCASCWAFSANGALEAHNFLRKGTGPIPLSEQNLIDCVRDNDGCDGGYMTNAYEYVRRNRGVDTEASYPYEARDNTKCRFQRANVGGECNSFMEIQEGNEEALQQAVATVGPVAAGIDGAQLTFQFYKSGYYYEPKCEQDVNHAVLIVGYGKTEKGEEYWIGKNSWDTDWGEAGYIRMAKNRNNHCGIANLASYPIV